MSSCWGGAAAAALPSEFRPVNPAKPTAPAPVTFKKSRLDRPFLLMIGYLLCESRQAFCYKSLTFGA
jgi:hypothetical protein